MKKNTYKRSNIELLTWMTKNGISLNDFFDIQFKNGKLCLIGNMDKRINDILAEMKWWDQVTEHEGAIVYRNEDIFVALG
jgi:hypothetical protein